MSKFPVSFQYFSNEYFAKNFADNIQYLFHHVYVDPTFVQLPAWERHITYRDTIHLSTYRKQMSTTIYPYQTENASCTLILLNNLEEPQWIFINCHEKILGDSVCFDKINTTESKADVVFNHIFKICLEFQLLRANSCHNFIWTHSEDFHIHKITLNNNVTYLYPLLYESRGLISPIILSVSGENIYSLLKYDKIFYDYKKHKAYNEGRIEGFVIVNSTMIYFSFGGNIFICSDKTFISALFVCNGIIDCSNDSSDEINCNSFFNKNLQRVAPSFTSKKYHSTPIYNLTVEDSSSRYVGSNTMHNTQFTCNNGKKINSLLMNDLVSDCGPGGDDEPILMQLLTDNVPQSCNNRNQIPCREGHSKCFNIFELCIYKLDNMKQLGPCRNGGHLFNCHAFECNMDFKCPDSYCVLYSYLCDGKWDGSSGADEKTEYCLQKIRCQNLYKCLSTYICIHVGKTCNNQFDCPLGDDEQLCDLKYINCPYGCQCLVFAIMCTELQGLTLTHYPYFSVSFFNTNLHNKHQLSLFKNVINFQLINLGLESMCNVLETPDLMMLQVQFNPLRKIKRKCLNGLTRVQSIDVSLNNISSIEKQAFAGQPYLLYINFSDNLIDYFTSDMFSHLPKLQIVILYRNPLNSIQGGAFDKLNLYLIETLDYRICCIAPSKVVCNAKRPWYESCSNLLPNKALTYTFIFISPMVIFLNLCSLGMNIVNLFRRNSSYTISVMSINCNDILYGSYLCIILAAHYIYNDTFLLKQKLWKNSRVCHMAFGIALTFNILSPILLSILSLSRLMVVIFPINTRFKQTGFCLKVALLNYTVGLVISILFVLVIRSSNQTLTTNLCFPLMDPSDYLTIIKYATWSVATLQMVASFVVLIMHFVVLKQLKYSQFFKLRSADNFKTPIVQLAIITGSNILCWISTNILYITFMSMGRYPFVMVIWTVVVVVPINSVVNPLVYMTVTLKGFIDSIGKPV